MSLNYISTTTKWQRQFDCYTYCSNTTTLRVEFFLNPLSYSSMISNIKSDLRGCCIINHPHNPMELENVFMNNKTYKHYAKYSSALLISCRTE